MKRREEHEPQEYENLDTVEILKVLGNPVRKAIVTSLASRHESLKFSDLMQASGLDPSFDTGHFGYHLSELMKSIDRFGFWVLGVKRYAHTEK